MKRFTLLLMLHVAMVATWAQQVSMSQASAIAAQFATAKGFLPAAPANATGSKALRHAYSAPVTTTDNHATTAYYVFNMGTDGGFVIVSADERTEPILGYSSHGHFDVDKLPDNARAWLDEVAAQIGYVQQQQLPSQRRTPRKAAAKEEPVKQPIAPMITTMWNQGAPYNNLCPMENGKRSVTGCVATAMAQVIYYHRANNPAFLARAIPDYYSSKDSMHVDGVPAGTLFDWDNMLDRYSGSNYTDLQANAVATLMLCCGVSVRMMYSSSASGAFSGDVPDALKTYFGFAQATTVRPRSIYSVDEWDAMLYNELTLNRPIYYSGSSMGGGHAFVIDGYDGAGLFHVNWGWGGSSNGYFLISILNPGDNSGIGASTTTDGYSMGQQALFNAEPAKVGQPTSTFDKVLRSATLQPSNGQPGFSFFNHTGETGNYNRGIGITRSDGTIVVLGEKGMYENLRSGTGWSESRFNLTRQTLTDNNIGYGTYEVLPISRRDNEAWKRCERSDANRLYVTHGSSGISLRYDAALEQMECTDFEVPLSRDANAKQTVNFTLHNNGKVDFDGTIYLTATLPNDATYRNQSRTGVKIKAGTSQQLSLSFTPNGAGQYVVNISTDSQAEKIVGTLQTTLTQGEIVTSTGLAAESTNMENMEGRTLYGSRVKANITLFNSTAKPFDGDIRVALYRSNHNGYYSKVSDTYVHAQVPSLNRQTVQATFDNLVLDEDYWLLYYYPNVSARFGSSNTFHTTYAAMQYDAEGLISVSKPATSLTVDEQALAVWLKGCGTTNVVPNSNPNTIYYFSASDAIPTTLQGRNIVVDETAATLRLTDGHDYAIPYAFEAQEAIYSRTPTVMHDAQGGWELLALPFAIDKARMADDGTTVEWCRSDTHTDAQFYLMQWKAYNAATQMLVFDYTAQTQANTPYLLGWPKSIFQTDGMAGKAIEFVGRNARLLPNATIAAHTSSFNLRGTQHNTAVTQGLVLDGSGHTFQRFRGTMYVPAFRAYADDSNATTAVGSTLYIQAPDNTINAINSVDNETNDNNAPWYNLQGQRTTSPQKGIYIRKGKKIVRP